MAWSWPPTWDASNVEWPGVSRVSSLHSQTRSDEASSSRRLKQDLWWTPKSWQWLQTRNSIQLPLQSFSQEGKCLVFVHQGEETDFMLLSLLSLCSAKITPFEYAVLLTLWFSKRGSALRALPAWGNSPCLLKTRCETRPGQVEPLHSRCCCWRLGRSVTVVRERLKESCWPEIWLSTAN